MSQLSQLLTGKISLTTFITDVEGDVASVVAKVETAIPSAAPAIQAIGTAATVVATDGVTWAEGALSSVAANLATDLEAVVQKYIPQVLGPTGATTTAGSVALAQQFGTLLQQLALGAGALIIKAL